MAYQVLETINPRLAATLSSVEWFCPPRLLRCQPFDSQRKQIALVVRPLAISRKLKK